jgi:polar amino acid transport system substrate-binding protein
VTHPRRAHNETLVREAIRMLMSRWWGASGREAMTKRIASRCLAALLGGLLALQTGVSVFAAEIRVMTSGALAAPFADLAPAFEAKTGHKIVTILGSSQGGASDSIPERLKRGEVAHALLLGREGLDALVKQGLVVAGSERDIVASRMAMAVRLGIPKPDISNVEAFKKAMREAKSIAYSASVSGTYLSTVAFQELGIADEVLPKSRRILSERVGAVLARGEADVGFQQISELLPFAKTTQFVGPLPEGVQKVTLFSAGVSANTPDAALSRAVIEFMASKEAHAMVRKYALDPVSATRDEQALAEAFAPTGTLRAVINLGNPVLARRPEGQPAPTGVSVDLAQELGKRLGLAVEPVVVTSAGAAVETIRKGEADIGFFAIDPARSEGITFTNPYVNIEGAYAVPADSPIRDRAEVDRPGVRIAVGRGSAYDLFLTREIKAAALVRAPTSQAVVGQLLDEKLEVAANVRQQLEADMAKRPGALRMLPGAFMTIHQAMGLAGGRDARAQAYLTTFVEEAKASGFVAEALKRHGVEGAAVAPAGPAR